MKKISLLLLAISFAVISFGQTVNVHNGDTINRTDAKNMKQGYWEETNNGLILKGNYLNDKKDGAWVTYSAKGTITKIESYKDGKKEGVVITIDENGYYRGEANYHNDLLDGVSRTYAVGARLMSETYYKNGMPYGLKKTFYENTNKLQEETNYVNGLRNGVTKWYDSNGKLVAEYVYKNGKFEGVNKTYSTNGVLITEETFQNNLQNGAYKEYYDVVPPVNEEASVTKDTGKNPAGVKENRSMASESKGAKENKADTKSSTEPQTPKIKISGNYVNGKKEGKWYEYDETGKIVKTTIFKDGVEKK